MKRIGISSGVRILVSLSVLPIGIPAVADGGIRIAGAGSDAIPFFAGVHVNAGEGPDDLRVFAGFLFHLDKIVQMFQAAQ